jgi:hypothetical protein
MRIAKAMGDPNLIRYSQGEISWDEYQQLKEQAMQKQMQMQMQMSQMDPQVQSANALAQAEHRKASAAEMNAQTKLKDVLNKAQQAQQNFKLQLVDLIMNGDMQARQQDLEELRTQIDQQQQIIELMREQENASAASPES